MSPFAQAWAQSNDRALTQPGPLWVALGDSMSQSIGARTIAGGWVGHLDAELTAAGHPMRLVNLSVSGAKVRDVVDDQLARLATLHIRPDLLTVLIGANDMLTRTRRTAAICGFRQLLELVPDVVAPDGLVVVGTLPRRNRESRAINEMIEAAAAAGRVRKAEMRGGSLGSWRGALADDLFHPNEIGYRRIARPFSAAVLGTA